MPARHRQADVVERDEVAELARDALDAMALSAGGSPRAPAVAHRGTRMNAAMPARSTSRAVLDADARREHLVGALVGGLQVARRELAHAG